MTKRFFTPAWKCEELESELARLEKEGWRLDKISNLRKFEFTKAPPKNTTYFLTFSTKGHHMYDYEYALKREYHALPVKGDISFDLTTSVYRIPTNADLSRHKLARNLFLRRLLLESMFAGLFLLALCVAGIVFCFLETGAFPIAQFIFFIPFALMGAMMFFPNLFGWIYLRKQYKKQMQSK